MVCCECPDAPRICLDCFSRGSVFGGHSPGHAYRVAAEDFSVLDPEWTAREEMQLLALLLQRGQGNWKDIAGAMHGGSKTAEQCREHFEVCVERSGENINVRVPNQYRLREFSDGLL